MFNNLSTTDWAVVGGIVGFVSLAIGWIANLVLDEIGFGIAANTALAMIGGSLGIWLLERALTWNLFTAGQDQAGWWMGAYLIGSLLFISLALIGRRMATR